MSRKLNLIIIEDNQDDVEIILNELGRGGYELYHRVVDGRDGLQAALENGCWDLILSDHNLPRFSAMQALEIVNGLGLDLPFIIVSGLMGEALAVDAMRAGAADVVMKDHLSRLLPAVQRVWQDAISKAERRRMERVQSALIQLSRVTMESNSLDELYRTIHNIISSLMPAQNFYISLYDEQTDTISYPYYIDEVDTTPPPEKLGRGLTAYVMRSGRSLLASPQVFDELVAGGEVVEEGAPSIDWLGVPLIFDHRPMGVLAVQSYTEGVRFTEEDQKILEFVSTQIAMAIHRTHSAEALKTESRFRKAIEDSILAGVIATDLEGRQSYVNPAFCRMVGWDEKQLLGALPPFVYWPPEEVDAIREAFAVVTGDDGIACDFEVRFMRGTGERFDAYLLLSPLTGDDGKLTGWLSSVYDITARKSNELALKRQKGRAEALARTAARLNARLAIQAIAETVCEETARALNVPVVCFFLYDPENDLFNLTAAAGLSVAAMRRYTPFSRSFLGWDLKTVESTIVVQDLTKTEGLKNSTLISELNLRTFLMSRMARADQIIGMLGVFTVGETRLFSSEELLLLDGLGDLATQAIMNARLFIEIERSLEHLHAVHAVDLAISASMDLRITLNILLDHAIQLLDVDAADILVFNHGLQALEFAVGRGFRTNLPGKMRQHVQNGFAGKVVFGRSQVLMPNLAQECSDADFGELARQEGLNAYLGVPLIAKGQVKGVMEIMSRTRLRVRPEWFEMVASMAGQAAIAIDNATLFDQLQRSNLELAAANDSTLEGWARAMELHENNAAGHTERVVELTLRLARRLGLREDEMADIRRGALLHDIGNIGIPNDILKKPGPLTQAEYAIVQQHPLFAFQIIAPISYLRSALDIPYNHHERWDGSGYPRQLGGEKIPLAARIFSVVDVWDALISDRPQRAAWSQADARAYIEAQAGIAFDPHIVGEFLGLI